MTLPPLTKQQQAILVLIYHHRFLSRIHIQAFLNHKNKKTINTWLPDLVTKDYLKRIYEPKSFIAKTEPAIYYLGLNGIRYLERLSAPDLKELRKRYKDSTRTTEFIQECLLLADISLSYEAKNSTAAGLYRAYTSTEVTEEISPYHFLIDIHPHLVLVGETNTHLKVSLLELIPPVSAKRTVYRRIRNYIAFYESGEWEEHADCPFPNILFVCPNLTTLISAKQYVKRLKEAEEFPQELSLWFTTIALIKQHAVTGEIWEGAR
jgi:hypothetical protein